VGESFLRQSRRVYLHGQRERLLAVKPDLLNPNVILFYMTPALR